MITCTREIGFDYGHRVFKHSSKCKHIHGHRGKVEVTAKPKDGLNSLGMVIDFSSLKEILGGWIDENWDHNFLVYKDDLQTVEAIKSVSDSKDGFVCDFNPTAENMANYLLTEICPKLFKDEPIEIIKIVLWETPNCFAEASL